MILVLCSYYYHQSEYDSDYLVFSCGNALSPTPSAWSGKYQTLCGLFNTSGDTEPNSPGWNQYVGSLDDYIHDGYYASTPFFLAGMRFYIDPHIVGGSHWAGVYFSGCGSWSNTDGTFGSQYYYFL